MQSSAKRLAISGLSPAVRRLESQSSQRVAAPRISIQRSSATMETLRSSLLRPGVNLGLSKEASLRGLNEGTRDCYSILFNNFVHPALDEDRKGAFAIVNGRSIQPAPGFNEGLVDSRGKPFLRPDGSPESFMEAQARRDADMLGALGVGPGRTLFDIGCGSGGPGVVAVEGLGVRTEDYLGISPVPEHILRTRARGLYTVQATLTDSFDLILPGTVERIVAKGSVEHWPNIDLVRKGNYVGQMREYGRGLHRLAAPGAEFGCSVIEFGKIRPTDLDLFGSRLVNLFRDVTRQRPRGTAILEDMAKGYVGWYPVRGELEQAFKGCWKLVNEVDLTDIYYHSAVWAESIVRKYALKHPIDVAWQAARALARNPSQGFALAKLLLFSDATSREFTAGGCRAVQQIWKRED